jgi:arsenite methyltransferase
MAPCHHNAAVRRTILSPSECPTQLERVGQASGLGWRLNGSTTESMRPTSYVTWPSLASPHVRPRPFLFRMAGRSRPRAARPLPGWGTLNGLVCFASAGMMLLSSKIGKARQLERLLDGIPWHGGERALEVGPGRGSLLIRAARRLTADRVVSVDLWRGEDQSGNSPEAAGSNAKAEGVGHQIAQVSGDARHVRFPVRVFDVVVSSLTLHNLGSAAERAQAVREVARVLKLGGLVALLDFRYTDEYKRVLRGRGLHDVPSSHCSFDMYPPVRAVTARQPI